MVKRMRWRSSFALPRLPKLKFAANCSAADGISHSRRFGSILALSGAATSRTPRIVSAFAGRTLFGGVGAALLALARFALLVEIDLLLEGRGDLAAGLFNRGDG